MPLQQTSGNVTADAYGGGVAAVPNYIEDVFSTYLYTGNGGGSATGFYGTQTIANGVDLSTKGGMVWLKARSSAEAHALFDTARGVNKILRSDYTFAQSTAVNTVTAFNTTGFNLGSDSDGYGTNTNAVTYASWTFRKQPKFFDVVTYTGTGSVQNIAHNLGSTPGCIIVKDTTNAGSAWAIYHTSLGNTQYLQFTTSAAGTSSGYWNNTSPTSTQFTVGTNGNVNQSGATYVAYLFAHNAGGFGLTGTDNVISCGSFDATSAGSVTLGYEPQWVLIKASNDVGSWHIQDNMRGYTTSGNNPTLDPDRSVAEFSGGYTNPTATGFTYGSLGSSFIYIAIRRGPMKVPTDGTKVFKPVAQSTSGSYPRPVVTNFPVDFVIMGDRSNLWGYNWSVQDRLRGNSNVLFTTASSSENNGALSSFAYNTQFGDGWVTGGTNGIYECLQRSPGFFDVVCYTGTGSATTQTHNLGVAPELIIVKGRNTAYGWPVYVASVGNDSAMQLQSTGTPVVSDYWNNTTPTASVFSLGTAVNTNQSTKTFVAYLFATCAGVSKVGSYTGNGTTQTINCGFTGGARFVLIKRTDSTGDWYVYDTARGMTVLTDPYLLLNSTAAESATLGSVTTVSTGFAVNASILAAINTNAASYIFLAIA